MGPWTRLTVRCPGPCAGRRSRCRERFEAAWKSADSADARPRIHDYLMALTEPERSSAFRTLLASELKCRLEDGEQPSRGRILCDLPRRRHPHSVRLRANGIGLPGGRSPAYRGLYSDRWKRDPTGRSGARSPTKTWSSAAASAGDPGKSGPRPGSADTARSEPNPAACRRSPATRSSGSWARGAWASSTKPATSSSSGWSP